MKNLITLLFASCLLLKLTPVLGQQTSSGPNDASISEVSLASYPTLDLNPPTFQNIKMQGESMSEWSGFHIGAVAQATFTDMKVEGANGTLNTSFVVGYGGGGFIGYFFSRNVEIRAEALYSALAQEITDRDVKRTLNLSYINFPMLMALHTGYDKAVSFNITFGPQIGINTGTKLEGSGSEGIDTVQATIDVKPADLGIAYGAGFDFGFGAERLVHLNVGFRGVCGIVDISESSNNSTTSDYYIIDRAKLRTYSGYAGLSVKF